jgi:hypothetical protein
MLVLIATLSVVGITMAAEKALVVPEQRLQKTVDVRDVRAQSDQVSGVLVNLSSKPVRDVQVRIDCSWLWRNERHPGPDSPERSILYSVAGEIPAGGSLSFVYRPETPLPVRSDGRFETSVSVVGFEQVG